MKLGFGSTVWLNGLNKKKLDGIGVYTQSLWMEFEKEKSITLKPLAFCKKESVEHSAFLESVVQAPVKFSIHTVLHSVLHCPLDELGKFTKDIDLFFAPDHCIPTIKGVPTIATVMDVIPFVHPEWVSPRFRSLKNYLFKKTILNAEHIITISDYSKKDIMKCLGISPDKISVVNLGVDKSFFERVTALEKQHVLNKYKIKKDFFIFVGTLQPRKNIIRIIQAHRKLPDALKTKHPLVIVGRYGWSSQELMDEISIMEENKDGTWLSFIEQNELYALYQSAIALVYPSLYEGFGLPIIEGFASQCPVITSNVTSIPEVAGDAVLQVNPTSIEEIKEAMEKLCVNHDLRESLIRKGNSRVQQYTWEKVAKSHIEIFNQVASQV